MIFSLQRIIYQQNDAIDDDYISQKVTDLNQAGENFSIVAQVCFFPLTREF